MTDTPKPKLGRPRIHPDRKLYLRDAAKRYRVKKKERLAALAAELKPWGKE